MDTSKEGVVIKPTDQEQRTGTAVIADLPVMREPHLNGNGRHDLIGDHRTVQQEIEAARAVIRQQEIAGQQPGENTHQAVQRIERQVVDNVLALRNGDRNGTIQEQARALLDRYLAGQDVLYGYVRLGGLQIEVNQLERQLRNRLREEDNKDKPGFQFRNITPEDMGRAGNPAAAHDRELTNTLLEQTRQRDIERRYSRPEGENTHARVQEVMKEVIGEVITPEVIAEMKYFSAADAHALIEAYRTRNEQNITDNSLGYMEIKKIHINQADLEKKLLNYVRRAIVQRMAGTTSNWVRTKGGEFGRWSKATYSTVQEKVNNRIDRARTNIETRQTILAETTNTARAVRDIIPESRHHNVDQMVSAYWVDQYLERNNLIEDEDGLIEVNNTPIPRNQLEQEVIRLCQATGQPEKQPEPSRLQKLAKWWKG